EFFAEFCPRSAFFRGTGAVFSHIAGSFGVVFAGVGQLAAVDGGIGGGRVVPAVVVYPAAVRVPEQDVVLGRAVRIRDGGLAASPGVEIDALARHPLELARLAVQAYPDELRARLLGQGGYLRQFLCAGYHGQMAALSLTESLGLLPTAVRERELIARLRGLGRFRGRGAGRRLRARLRRGGRGGCGRGREALRRRRRRGLLLLP